MVNLPAPFSDIPRHHLSYNHASPIHPLPNLTQKLNSTAPNKSCQVQLWAKREDQAGSLACYGNKYRKFEYLVPDVLSTPSESKPRVTALVTEGGIQSNHTVQVAALARLLRLKCFVLLHKGIGGWRESKDPDAFLRTGNVQANKLLGAKVRITDESDTGDAEGPLLPILEELKTEGEIPYWISSGASLHPLGGLGYARAAFEIVEQEQEIGRTQLQGAGRFDYIFVACGSGSTFAGLIAGFKLLEKMAPTALNVLPRQIIGVMTSPTKSKIYQEQRILGITKTAAKLIGLNPETDVVPEDVRLDDRFVGTAYGILDKETQETLESVSGHEAMFLDPVYTAKVMCGVMTWVQEGEIVADYQSKQRESVGEAGSLPSSLNVLFIHTGGQSALSAYADLTESTLKRDI